MRRHGRKKKAKDGGKESEEKELEKPGPAVGGRRGDEELQETQLQTLKSQNEEGELEVEDEPSRVPSYFKNAISLRDVLDEHLSKEQWSQKVFTIFFENRLTH